MKRKAWRLRRRKGTPSESPPSPLFAHLFVGDVPLLYPTANVLRQIKVENWLDLTWALYEIKPVLPAQSGKKSEYVV